MVAAPRRYRLKLATWTVVREPGQPSPRTLSSPLAVVELAKDLVLAADDDKEHFLVVLLNAQNHYLLHTEVSVGTQSASLVHPRLCVAAHKRGYVAVAVMWCSGRNRWRGRGHRPRNAT